LSVDAVGDYQGRLAAMIKRLKFGAARPLARSLGALLAERTKEPLVRKKLVLVRKLIPMPLDPDRLRQRGFNQSALVARYLAEVTRLQLDEQALKRRCGHAPQIGRSASQRRFLPADAFVCVGHRVWGRHVVLLDDVITTGSSLRAATRCLMEAGALGVRCLVVARTPNPAQGIG